MRSFNAKSVQDTTPVSRFRSGVSRFTPVRVTHMNRCGLPPDFDEQSHVLLRECSRRDIGFNDSSNLFYLFSKMKGGLLLLAPFASTMGKAYSFVVMLVLTILALMPMATTARTESSSSAMKAGWSCSVPLALEEIPARTRLRDHNSSNSMFSLPWEGDE